MENIASLKHRIVKKTEHRPPLLHVAASNGHAEVTKLLLADCRVEVNCSDLWGRTPLHYAAKEGNTEVVQLFLADQRVEVNTRNCWGQTPLHYATINGHTEVIQLLATHPSVDLDTTDEEGRGLEEVAR